MGWLDGPAPTDSLDNEGGPAGRPSKRGKRVTADPPRPGRAEQRGEAEARLRCFPHALLQREQDGAAPRPASHLFSRTLFSSFSLQQQWDLCPERGGRRESWPPAADPSAVSEILAHAGTVVALTDSGQCMAYRVGSPERVCLLNVAPGEAVRSVFINTAGSRVDLVLFSLHAPHYSLLRVRRMPLASAAAGNPHDWTPLFVDASLAWPGFVELDGVAGRGLTYDAVTFVYRAWCLASYQCLFEVQAGGQVMEVRIGPPDLLLLVMQPQGGALPLRLLSFRDGSLLRETAVALGGSGWVPELVELFGCHVLLMAADGPLRIVDMMAAGGGAAVREVPSLGAPSALVHTPLNRCFLAFYDPEGGGGQGVAAWSFDGRRLAALSLPTLTGPHASTVYVSSRETLLFMWDGGGGGGGGGALGRGGVHVIDLRAGLAKVAMITALREVAEGGGEGGDSLRRVTAIYYDEARQEMYTGSADGRIGVWAA